MDQAEIRRLRQGALEQVNAHLKAEPEEQPEEPQKEPEPVNETEEPATATGSTQEPGPTDAQQAAGANETVQATPPASPVRKARARNRKK